MSDDEEHLLEDEVEEEEDGDDVEKRDIDSSEEEEEGQDEYEEDGFLVNEDDDEGGEDDDSDQGVAKKKKKKKEKKRKTFELDEDDYDLLEDNQVQVKRPTGHKRLKRGEEQGTQKYSARERLEEDLFGGREDLEDVSEEEREDARERVRQARRDEEEEDDLEMDELDDFIVEGDEGEEGGRQRRRKNRMVVDGISTEALEIAQDLFGDVDELVDTYLHARRQHDKDAADEELREDELDDASDEEDEENRTLTRQEKIRQQQLKRVMKVLDPEMVAEQHLLPQDLEIRERDIPERMQLGAGKLLRVVAESDWKAAAKWVYETMKAQGGLVWSLLVDGINEVEGNPTDENNRLWRDTEVDGIIDETDFRNRRGVKLTRNSAAKSEWLEKAQEGLQDSIMGAISYFWEKSEEVPVVAMYRKGEMGDLMAMRQEDTPLKTTQKELESMAERAEKKLIEKIDHLYKEGMVQPHHRRIRRWEVLWRVYELSLMYLRLLDVKNARQKVYLELQDKVEDPEDKKALDLCLSELESASTFEQLDDIEARFRLVQEANRNNRAVLESAGVRNKPQRSSLYYHYRAARFGELLNKIVISPPALAECLQKQFGAQAPLIKEEPAKWAEAMINEYGLAGYGYGEPERLLLELQKMAVQQLLAEPEIRAIMREKYFRCAVVTTSPTELGERELDPFHMFGSVKRLDNKPVHSFAGSVQFLKIVGAERKRLIDVKIEVPENTLKTEIVDVMEGSYLRADMGDAGRAWDEKRRQIILSTVSQLLPVLLRDLRAKLLKEARQVALEKASEEFWKVATTAPLQLVDRDDMTVTAMRVAAIVWGPGGKEGQNTVAVFVNEYGALVDLLHLGQFSGNIPQKTLVEEKMFSDERKGKDLTHLREKIYEFAPHAIIVGASSPACRTLFEDMEKLHQFLIIDRSMSRSFSLLESDLNIRYDNETIPALWENSKAAISEFPEQPLAIRRAIALARFQINPLAVIASLCGPSMEILSLKLSPLQENIPREAIVSMIEQVMVTVTCQVGVDINLAAAMPWQAAPLPFVAGLGRRKASALLKAVSRSGNNVDSRSQIWKKLGVMGKFVFRNCGPFLRVSAGGLKHLENVKFELIDSSRIQPETYRLAVSLAGRAVGREDLDLGFESKVKMQEVDLEAFIEETEMAPSKLTNLIDMVAEFVLPNYELRPPRIDYCIGGTSERRQLYLLMHGETEETLQPGKIVEAQVRFIGRNDVRLSLVNSGVDAILNRDYISENSDRNKEELETQFWKNQVVRARILNPGLREEQTVRKQQYGNDMEQHEELVNLRFVLPLTTREKEMADSAAAWEKALCQAEDPFYKIIKDEKKIRERDARRIREQNTPVTVIPRPIKHPAFENLSGNQVAEKIQKDPDGSFRLRPSLKGIGYFAMTMKIADATFLHMDFTETRKAGSFGHGVGYPLVWNEGRFGEEKFEDLDELVAVFIEPLWIKLQEVMKHGKFIPGTLDEEVEAALLAKGPHKDHPPGKPYAAYGVARGRDLHKLTWFRILFAKVNPGSIEPPKWHTENFQVTHKGFEFRKKTFLTVDKMLDAFKRDPAGPRGIQTEVQDPVAESGYNNSRRPPGTPQHYPAMRAPPTPQHTRGDYNNYRPHQQHQGYGYQQSRGYH